MRTLAVASCAVALLTLATGCAPVTVRWQSPTGVSPMEAGTPSGNVAAREVSDGREVRYYRDESGAIWDDRGRKLAPGEKPPGAATP